MVFSNIYITIRCYHHVMVSYELMAFVRDLEKCDVICRCMLFAFWHHIFKNNATDLNNDANEILHVFVIDICSTIKDCRSHLYLKILWHWLKVAVLYNGYNYDLLKNEKKFRLRCEQFEIFMQKRFLYLLTCLAIVFSFLQEQFSRVSRICDFL